MKPSPWVKSAPNLRSHSCSQKFCITNSGSRAPWGSRRLRPRLHRSRRSPEPPVVKMAAEMATPAWLAWASEASPPESSGGKRHLRLATKEKSDIVRLVGYLRITPPLPGTRQLRFSVATPPPPLRTTRQFDDVPLNVVFGEPVSQNRGPRLDSPCRLFCWLGLPASFCRESGKTLCFWTSSLRTHWKNVFLREILGSKHTCMHVYIHYTTLHYIT